MVERDCVVGIGIRYGLDGSGIGSRWGQDFLYPSRPAPEAHPAFYATGTGLFLELERPERDANHPPHLASRLKKE